ncbi:MAG: sodium-dependent transporter [bacterium]
MSSASEERESWNTRLGFILAAIGSAVGLGNIWRFPYMTAESGGASFVVLYLLLLFLIGMPVMIAEFVIGRKSRLSPVKALSTAGDYDWSPLGFLFVITGFMILSYYSVVAGWTLQYMVDSAGGVLTQHEPGTYFDAISTGTRAIFFHTLFMVITTCIVLAGVKQGIENTVKFLIPTLVVLLAGLGIWAYFQPGAGEGYAFYLEPNYNKLFSSVPPFVDVQTLADAAGQTFFTLSLGMGAMITYSSYLSQDEDLVEETLIISISNVSIAFLAGLIVFPIISAFGLRGEIAESTISTLFIAIPKAFQSIGGFWGGLLGFTFFGCLFLAALTSAISLLEVVTSTLIDQFDLRRVVAAAMSGGLIYLLGIPAALNLDWLSMADQIAGNLLLMLGGFLLTIYVGWLMSEATEELQRGLSIPVLGLWVGLIRYVVPLVMFALLVLTFWDISYSMLQDALPSG